jgi:hypothetical protein
MNVDHIVIGSGACALATVLGLDPRQSTLVIGGPAKGEFSHYARNGAVPCAFLGEGGLGNHWHGVIPLRLAPGIDMPPDDDFLDLFRQFYPRTSLAGRLRQELFFLPWRAIRPSQHWPRLVADRPGRLTLMHETVERIRRAGATTEVVTREGRTLRAGRVWVAAGSVHTPGLLDRSLGDRVSRGTISDHVLCYLGVAEGLDAPTVKHTREGIFFQGYYPPSNRTLYMLRPARFGYRQLDYSIQLRAVFGMPTGRAVAKIMRGLSGGLLAEAFYNRFGVGARSPHHSVYGQIAVDDAYELAEGAFPLVPRIEQIRRVSEQARAEVPFAGLLASQRPDLYVPGIHLYHSVDAARLQTHDVDTPDSPIQVVDASTLADIGPDHPTFKAMVRAYVRARRASQGF